MIQPEIAIVRPCVQRNGTGDPISLEFAVRPFVASSVNGSVAICGRPGSGKTTALRHLAAVLPAGPEFLDEPDQEAMFAAADRSLVFYTTEKACRDDLATFTLIPWGLDEWIEYLLAQHHEQCGEILERLKACQDVRALQWLPLLTRIVLDEYAADPELDAAVPAISRFVESRIPDETWLRDARTYALATFFRGPRPSRSDRPLERITASDCDPRLKQAIRYEPVQLLFATQRVLLDLHRGDPCKYFVQHLDPLLLNSVGRGVQSQAGCLNRLREFLGQNSDSRLHATTAAILVASVTGWTPDVGHDLDLQMAYLVEAQWSGATLSHVLLSCADLSGADLREVDFKNGIAHNARFTGARLHGARLHDLGASACDLSGCDLSYVHGRCADFSGSVCAGADFEGAMLVESNFSGADFSDARLVRANMIEANLAEAALAGANCTSACFKRALLEGIDFRATNLHGATFTGARCAGCNFEYQEMPAARFLGVHADEALFTGSVMRDACFRRAILRSAGLAEVDWQGVDLRHADLRGASFHGGSSRSGLVDSLLASEGTRTGFYTDDYDDQYHLAPEDIRKANLRGADLRGALIEETDFYLVDLRDAHYDREQEEHLRRCKAILESRV